MKPLARPASLLALISVRSCQELSEREGLTAIPELWRQSNIMPESARKTRAKSAKTVKSDSNRVRIRRDHSRTVMQLGVLAEARRDMLHIAQDYSPAAMLRICEMGGLVQGVEPATSEAVRLACCVEVLDRAHGRPRPALDASSHAPLLVDFAWASDAPQRLLEGAAIGHDDSETP